MFKLTMFTPAEAAEMTGVSTMTQRDMRRRGFIPVVEGHARFDPFALAELQVFRLLADRGVGQAQCADVVPWAATGIMWHALFIEKAYSGDHLRTFEWEPEGRGVKQPVDDKIRAVFEEHGAKIPPEINMDDWLHWQGQAQWIARRIISRVRRVRVIPAPYFVWWPDETHSFVESLDDAFRGQYTDAQYDGAVIVIDLGAAAAALVQRAGRALVQVSYDKDRAGNVLSPDPELEFGEPIPLQNKD